MSIIKHYDIFKKDYDLYDHQWHCDGPSSRPATHFSLTAAGRPKPEQYEEKWGMEFYSSSMS